MGAHSAGNGHAGDAAPSRDHRDAQGHATGQHSAVRDRDPGNIGRLRRPHRRVMPSAQARRCGRAAVSAAACIAADQGTVYWITGLAAAGKTTLATRLWHRLRRSGRPAVLLDGDRLRAVLDAEAAHAPEDRLRLALTYGRLCRELAGQGLDVVCATISMFHAVRDWNRAHIGRYREIYLRIPIAVAHARDPKGIYARHREGVQQHVVGQDLEAELPRSPDLVIDNGGALSPDAAVDLIWETLVDARAGVDA